MEHQLAKTKQWIKDLGHIKEDIQSLKHASLDTESADRLATENEILKSKIQDLETRVSTLSRDESRLEDKYRLEKVIAGLTDDNRLVNEKYQIIQQQILKAEGELVHWKEAA